MAGSSPRMTSQPLRRSRRRRGARIARQIVLPDGVLAQRGDEFAVRDTLGLADARNEWRGAHANDRLAIARLQRARDGLGEAELRLAGADELDIDLGQDFGVEQRAVLGAA